MSSIVPAAAEEFRREGIKIFPQVLPPLLLRRLRRLCDVLYKQAPPQFTHLFPYHGSMIPAPYWEPAFTELILHRAAINVMSTLEFSDPKWVSGYVISKPPQCMPLWWHQDWWAWNDPVSAEEAAPYVFFIYYLDDTSPSNGCLRVIPASHRKRLDLHDQLPIAHSPEINECSLQSAAHAVRHDEVAVPVRAGDLVVGDARLLHATFANRSTSPRTCITLWYAPNFMTLPASIRAKLASQHAVASHDTHNHDTLMQQACQRLSDILPTYSGPCINSAPYSPTPGKYLRG